MKKIYLSVLFAVFFLGIVAPSSAQYLAGKQAAMATQSLWFLHNGNETTDAPQDGYHDTSVENLSKLYWALGMLDEKNETSVEQFLFINDCDMFNKFSSDPEQWTSLKEATRQMLCRGKANFLTRFGILMPVPIAAYDPAKKEFTIDPAAGLGNLQKLDVSSNTGVDVCGSKQDFKSYPRGLTVNLVQPFSLSALPASPELVDFYNKHKTYGKVTTYLRLKTRMGEYIETAQGKGGWHAVVTGTVDGYEIYSDAQESKILFAQDLPKIKLEKRVEKKPEAEAAPATGGSLNDLYSQDKAPSENDGSAAEDDPCGGPAKGTLP